MVTLFGTDGVRGLVNSTLMPELAYQLGRAEARTSARPAVSIAS